MSRISTRDVVVLLVILLHVPAGAADIEKAGTGWHVTLGRQTCAKIEAAVTVSTEGRKAPDPRVHYAFLQGERLGTIEILAEGEDFRGIAVPPGRYELIYQRQPPLKDHVDTSEYRDFIVLTGPRSPGPPDHPLVLALVPPSGAPGDPVTMRAEGGMLIAELDIARERVAIVLPEWRGRQ